MREPERHGLAAKLLKAADRLSGHSRPLVDTPTPLGRRKTTPVPSSQSSARIEPHRRRSSYQPPTLVFEHLPPRTHCLTPPLLNDPPQTLPKLDEQSQSPLFRLPKEVRLLIYKEVVGNRVLHVVRRPLKLGHKLCRGSGERNDCRENNCRGLKMPNGVYIQSGLGNGDLIQLLQSCRRIYSEATDVLYSSNVFDFDSMESLISFSCAILPQRFDSIQNVQLDFRFNLSTHFSETTPRNDWPRWERTWRVLASMKALQNIWVLVSWHREMWSLEERKLLEPLWLLTHMKTFEVRLPPLKGEEMEWSEDTPFRVVRRNIGSQ